MVVAVVALILALTGSLLLRLRVISRKARALEQPETCIDPDELAKWVRSLRPRLPKGTRIKLTTAAAGPPIPPIPPPPPEPKGPLPRRKQTSPIVAWRYARIIRVSDGWAFGSLNRWARLSRREGEPYMFGMEDEAVCATGGCRRVPNPAHECGFYSMEYKPGLLDRQRVGLAAEWLLEVEIYGTVVHHNSRGGLESGWRSQFQRVRRILPPPCNCDERAVFAVVRGDHIEVACRWHAPTNVPLERIESMLGQR